MENNNVLNEVQEVLVNDKVIGKPNRGLSKLAIGVGIGILVGGLIYKKFAKPDVSIEIEETEITEVEETEIVDDNEGPDTVG